MFPDDNRQEKMDNRGGSPYNRCPMSLDVAEVAKERLQSFLTEAIRYWQIIGQSGLALTVILLFLTGLIYYEEMVANIPRWWPTGFTLAVIFTWLVVRAPQRHFIEEADLIFLTPIEKEMEAYFRLTVGYNLLLQMAGLVVLLILFYPFFRDLVQSVGQPGWGYFLLPLVLKGWNYMVHWSLLRRADQPVVRWVSWGRALFSLAALLWWFEQWPVWLLIPLAGGGAAFFLVERLLTSPAGCPWLLLLELEKKQKSRFYAFCQAFVDVPHMARPVRRRGWLEGLVRLPFQQRYAFHYLQLYAWLRSPDYFGIYVRLTLLGMAGLVLVDDLWSRGLIYGLVLLITGIQLKGMAYHRRHLWTRLFPLSDELFLQGHNWLKHRLLAVQAVFLLAAIMLTGKGLFAGTLYFLAAQMVIPIFFWAKKKRGRKAK